MLFLGNHLYFTPGELEAIRDVAEEDNVGVAEAAERLLDDKEPEILDMLRATCGGAFLHSLEDKPYELGVIGNPRRPVSH